jgi:hypothetical protein
MPAKQARSIVFTHNNPAEGDIQKLQSYDCEYCVVGEEVGESGTPHLQGYMKFAKKKSLKKIGDELTKLLGKRPHIEPCRGGPKKAIEYCMKDGKVTEWGEKPKQGKRSDIEHAAEMIRSGARMIEVADEHPGTFVRYSRGLEKLKALHDKESAEDWRDVEVTLLTGPTGCGKTRKAMEAKCEDGRSPYKIQGSDLKWWDGYEGESVIVIDEYANNLKIDALLGLLDGYKKRLEIKGGTTWARWTKVFITTNLFVLHEQAKDAHREALERRISKTISYWEHAGVSAMAETRMSDKTWAADP